MARIYIAAPFELHAAAQELGMWLEEHGHEITSGWHTRPADEGSLDEQPGLAESDLADISAAEVIVLINLPGWRYKGTGGRHFETGYAFALGKRIIVLGIRSHLFHYCKSVTVINNHNSLKELL